MISILLRILTAVEIALFLHKFHKEHKYDHVLRPRQKYDGAVHPPDGPARSDILDDVPVESRAYQNYYQTKQTNDD